MPFSHDKHGVLKSAKPSPDGEEPVEIEVTYTLNIQGRNATLTVCNGQELDDIELYTEFTDDGVVRIRYDRTVFDDASPVTHTIILGEDTIDPMGTLNFFGEPFLDLTVDQDTISRLKAMENRHQADVRGNKPPAKDCSIPDDVVFTVEDVEKRGESNETTTLLLPAEEGDGDDSEWYRALYDASPKDVADNMTHERAVKSPFDGDHDDDTVTLREVIDEWYCVHPRDVRDEYNQLVRSDHLPPRYSHTVEFVWEEDDEDDDEDTIKARLRIYDDRSGVTHHVILSNNPEEGFDVEATGLNDAIGDSIPDDVATYARDKSPIPTYVRA